MSVWAVLRRVQVTGVAHLGLPTSALPPSIIPSHPSLAVSSTFIHSSSERFFHGGGWLSSWACVCIPSANRPDVSQPIEEPGEHQRGLLASSFITAVIVPGGWVIA